MKRENCPILSVFLLILAGVVFFPLLPAAAAETTGVEGVSCDCSAYVADPDPAGTNVRSGPGKDYSIVRTLPGRAPIEVTIVGAAGEWIKINEAYIFADGSDPNIKEDTTLTLSGWVWGPLLGVDTRVSKHDPEGRPSWYYLKGVPLYAEPNADSPILAALPGGTGVTILGCKDKWLKIRYEKLEGWLGWGSYCPSAVTTCP